MRTGADSALPALEHLELMNVDYGDYRVDLTDFLITDNILHSVFVDFVKSRLEEPVLGVFRVKTRSDIGEGSSCAPVFHGRLQELAADGNGMLLCDLTKTPRVW
ncbi:hypothetical protein B0H14DRAFT_3432133 [Mycena olivaceomarginata]|nr:hypothetical protein B0H14DRAFT_3432133 [Mycena olivaceomarginata]